MSLQTVNIFCEKLCMLANDKKKPLVKNMIENFETAGLDVLQANYDGYQKPELIQNQSPDVIGWDSKKELYYMGAVMKPDEFNMQEIGKKINVLSNLMMGKGNSTHSRIPFYLGLPKGTSKKVSDIFDEKNIPRDNVFTIEI
ncbi:MAG TPA: hypothetical protein VFG25_01860 [Nitrosopumilaceae archaeon]|nr:hypothetical protein [Nitrosopumilaceae archaeon]